MRRGRRKQAEVIRVPINNNIRARELRVIDDEGSSLGVLSKEDALKKAQEAGLDLVEVTSKAKPPVAKITDYGKFLYDLKKKKRSQKKKSNVTETKNVQVKVGTGEHDLNLKAKKASEWLREGHRVKVELYLRGRAKYMEKKFHEERINRFLKLISEQYKIAQEMRKGPKGLFLIIERDKLKKKKDSNIKEDTKEVEPPEKTQTTS